MGHEFADPLAVQPRESMPAVVQFVMLGAPTTHFVVLAQASLYRAAGWRWCGRDSSRSR